MEKVLQRATERNLKLNKDKSQIRLKQISYIGHVLGEDGIKPDPQKVRAISEMERPNCKEELQRFLGMATYLSKFIPNYSEEAAPLRNLLEKETEWHWEESQEKSFQHLKSMVTNSPVLQFFDPQKSTRISVDASSSGMGAVLLQDQHPIATDVFISDNGPQFSSEKFRVFAQTYQFHHKTSSPYHPQSNGKAERTVQTVKNLLKKAQEDQKDPYLALLDFCNIPMNEQVGSPAQQLMGRKHFCQPQPT